MKLAINGFGRIGRAIFKIAFDKKGIDIVAINDLTDNETLAHLLKYDTVFGKYDKKVSFDKNNLIVNGKKIKVLSEKDPKKLPWKKMKVDVVAECTGRFVKDGAARAHVKAGAKKVVISAPAKGGGKVDTIVLGANEYEGQDVVSNASCTTNCISPVMKVLCSQFGVQKAMMTTIHSYTADQNLQDGPHRDKRRARAAAQNMVPTSTGAAVATTEAIPELENLFDGIAIRVPTVNVSLADVTVLLGKDTTVEEVNKAIVKASKSSIHKGILAVTDEPLVSSDFIGNPHSLIVDLALTQVVDKNLVKVVAWYDNEWGYSNRMVELIQRIGKA